MSQENQLWWRLEIKPNYNKLDLHIQRVNAVNEIWLHQNDLRATVITLVLFEGADCGHCLDENIHLKHSGLWVKNIQVGYLKCCEVWGKDACQKISTWHPQVTVQIAASHPRAYKWAFVNSLQPTVLQAHSLEVNIQVNLHNSRIFSLSDALIHLPYEAVQHVLPIFHVTRFYNVIPFLLQTSCWTT